MRRGSAFENRLPAGHIVPTVPVDEYQTSEAVLDEVLQQIVQQIEISARRGGESPGNN